MQIGACGMACGICAFLAKGVCPGCCSGTDPNSPAKLEEMIADGFPCPALECAIKRKVDYCLNCDKIPCDVLYQGEIPYSRKELTEGLGELRRRVNELEKK